MFKLVALSLAIVSQLGDASFLKKTISGEKLEKPMYWPRGLSGNENENAKTIYNQAVAEFPIFKYRPEDLRSCDSYDKDQIYVTLYTKSSPYGQKFDMHFDEAVENSTYDPKKYTKIIVGPLHNHKYLNSSELVTAYLRHYKEHVNVITVNYVKFFGCDYVQAAEIHDYLVETVSHLVRKFHDKGTLLDNIHMIGFGMSAHLVGAVAKSLRPYKVGRITGLEPTGGAFDHAPWLGQLQADDADVVDIILTNTRKYGTKIKRGTVYFYPNGGEIQPESDDFTSHLKAFAYFIESVARPHAFESVKANSWSDYTRNNTFGTVAYMGEYVSKRVYGDFFLYVNPLPPYGKNTKDDFTSHIQDVHRRNELYRKVQNALRKENLIFEGTGTFSQDVSVEEARNNGLSARRVYDYVRHASDSRSLSN